MKSLLGGLPQLRVAFGEEGVGGGGVGSRAQASPVSFRGVSFGDRVDSAAFENSRVLSFYPCDGEFVVMKYRVAAPATVPFRVVPELRSPGVYKLELGLRIRALFGEHLQGTEVEVRVPVPACTTSVVVEVDKPAPATHSYEYIEAQKCCVWRIQTFPGEAEFGCTMRMSLGTVVTATVEKEVGPVVLDFEIPNYSTSGLCIRSLQIEEKSKSYNPSKWIRSFTRGSSYECRVR